MMMMIYTASELAMIEALLGGDQVEILFGEWDRKRAIMAQMLVDAEWLRDRPDSEKDYEVGQMRAHFIGTALAKHDEVAQQRPHADPLELMCPRVGSGRIGSRAKTFTVIDARLTV